jgi:hypothetical protein
MTCEEGARSRVLRMFNVIEMLYVPINQFVDFFQNRCALRTKQKTSRSTNENTFTYVAFIGAINENTFAGVVFIQGGCQCLAIMLRTTAAREHVLLDGWRTVHLQSFSLVLVANQNIEDIYLCNFVALLTR